MPRFNNNSNVNATMTYGTGYHGKVKRLATQVFIGAYQGVTSANEIERIITDEEWDAQSVICTNLAIATKDIAGCTKIREMGNPAALEAAASGAILGGLIGGMSRLMVGASKRPSVIQTANDPSLYEEEKAVMASKRPSIIAKVATNHIGKMDQTRLKKIGSALVPGSSAIICVFDEVLVKQIDYDQKMKHHQREMSDLTDHVVTKINDNLRNGSDVAFHIVVDEHSGDISWTRTVVGDDAIQVRDIVMSHDSIALEEVTRTTTKKTTSKNADMISSSSSSDSSNEEEETASEEVMTETVVMTPESIATARTLLRNSVTAYEVSYEDLIDDEERDIRAGDQSYETGVIRQLADGSRDVMYEKSTIHGEEKTYEQKIKIGAPPDDPPRRQSSIAPFDEVSTDKLGQQ